MSSTGMSTLLKRSSHRMRLIRFVSEQMVSEQMTQPRQLNRLLNCLAHHFPYLISLPHRFRIHLCKQWKCVGLLGSGLQDLDYSGQRRL